MSKNEFYRIVQLYGSVFLSSIVSIALLKAVVLNGYGYSDGHLWLWLGGSGAFCLLLFLTWQRCTPGVWRFKS